MLSVAVSGIVGRFLYVLIPRNVKGGELTAIQINEQFDAQERLMMETEIGREVVHHIDRSFAIMKRPETYSQTIALFFRLQHLKYQVKTMVHAKVTASHLDHALAVRLIRVASARATLIQKSLLLLQIEILFYYWHAIHLPFTAIMFITLALHVGVALWLGYTWIF